MNPFNYTFNNPHNKKLISYLGLSRKSFLIFILLISVANVFGQSKDQAFGYDEINLKYLEFLVKTKIDSVRLKHNCNILTNDSVLYVASLHHSNYMLKKNELTHFENEYSKFKTPQLRTEFYGGINYLVGENVIQTYYNKNMGDKHGLKFKTYTYESLANSIVLGWVNSPGHFKNMITPDYDITGLSIVYDSKSKIVYSCQNFAQVPDNFSNNASDTFFDYSNFNPAKTISSFDEVPPKTEECVHEFDLKHNDKTKCEACYSIVAEHPNMTFEIKNKSFVLKIENSEYVKKLISNPNDGFAVEIVEYNDYACGNPEYYSKPSRRNGQCKLNGRTTKPLYRSSLYIGFKGRKNKKDVKYLSYILGADSVPFFKRFREYKYAKFSSKYFEINLGKIPKDIDGLWEYNLVYIQNKEICYIDYFRHLCSEVKLIPEISAFIPLLGQGHYSFELEKNKIQFNLPFKKNATDFSADDLKPFFNSIENLKFTIDSIHIKAFASIEGDSSANAKLHQKRAQNISKALQGKQINPISTRVNSFLNWKDFYTEVSKYNKWKYLAKKSKAELQKIINTKLNDSLEFILSKGRYATITAYYAIDTSAENLKYYINKELVKIQDSSKLNISNVDFQWHCLNKLYNLYRFIHRKVMEKELDVSLLANLSMPKNILLHKQLSETYILFGHQFKEDFSKTIFWKNNANKLYQELAQNEINNRSPQFIYLDCKLKIDSLQKLNFVSIENVEPIISELELLQEFYYEDSINASNINKLYLNVNVVLMTKVFKEDPLKYSEDVIKSLQYIEAYYDQNGLMNAERAMQIAKTYVHSRLAYIAIEILKPFIDNDEILVYYLDLLYSQPSLETNEFNQELIEYSNKMDLNIWCNIFMSDCGIPFQVFENEELRKTFCEKCNGLNKTINKLKD